MDKLDLIVKMIQDVQESQERTNERLEKLEATAVKNTADLEHHIKRTDLAEENIELLRIEIKPITEHISALKILGSIVAAIGGFLLFLKSMGIF